MPFDQGKRMRRKDREVTDLEEQLGILARCDVCRLAFYDTEFPYIVPMNFGWKRENATLFLYFHCAGSGEKLKRMAAHPQVGFEMDCGHRLIEAGSACGYSMEYESLIGRGIASFVPDEHKLDALACIMQHYRPDRTFSFEPERVKRVTVFQVAISSFTAKRLHR